MALTSSASLMAGSSESAHLIFSEERPATVVIQGDVPHGAVAVLLDLDNQFTRVVVGIRLMEHQHHVGILLQFSRSSQIRKFRPAVGAGFDLAIELRQR